MLVKLHKNGKMKITVNLNKTKFFLNSKTADRG